MKEYINRMEWNIDTDKKRPALLLDFQDRILFSDYGPSDRKDLRFCTSKRYQSTHGYRTARTDYPKVLNGREALEYIMDGNNRLKLFWGDPVAGTGDLVNVDIDDRSLAEDLPDTLTVNSGEHGHHHRIYHNVDGSVRNEWVSGKSSKVNADPNGYRTSWTMVPGTVHGRERIYHIEDDLPIADLRPSDLPDALQP